MGRASKRKRESTREERRRKKVLRVQAPAVASLGIDAPKKEKDDRELILVAVPCTGNSMTLHMTSFLMGLREGNLTRDLPWRFAIEITNDLRWIPFVRNYLCGKALKMGASRLWMIDADMMPTGSTMKLLEATDYDIVAANMFKWDNASPLRGPHADISLCAYHYNIKGDKKWMPVIPGPEDPEIMPVDSVGTGCIVIKREVLEDPRMHLDGRYVDLLGNICHIEDEQDDPMYAPAIFRELYKPNGRRLAGSDLEFATRAKANGYSIGVHLGSQIGHWKPVNLNDVFNLVNRKVKETLSGQFDRPTSEIVSMAPKKRASFGVTVPKLSDEEVDNAEVQLPPGYLV